MLSREKIFAEMEKLGYKVFTEGDYNLNLIGLRILPGEPNKFDDVMTVSYKVNGVWQFHTYECTTDPGTYWLQNPMRLNGTAVLIPGQYKSCWKIGLHQGKYKALVQNGSPFKNWRDGNKNNTVDYKGPVLTDVGGLNLHHAGKDSLNVDKWSAACQVLAQMKDWEQFISLCEQQVKKGKGYDTFTYTLLEFPKESRSGFKE